MRLAARLAPLCIAFLFSAGAASAAPDLVDKFSMGSGGGTDHKPQSKLWFHDGSWWTIVYDGSNQRIWKFENGAFTKQTYADAAVDSRATARADVLWDGSFLYVLMWHDVMPRFSKYSYDISTQTYSRLPGFPVDLPIPGTEVLVMDKDSTGRLWASFELNLEIRTIWTTTPDHLIWNTTGLVLETNVDSDDITATTAFGGNKIGVAWSDQSIDAPWRFGFRVHLDSDPPEVWQPLEIVDTGSAVDDHIHLTEDADGRVYLAAKSLYNTIQLYVRSTSGLWTKAATNINAGNATRPIVMIDSALDLVRVFYTDWITSPNPIKMATAPRSTMVFAPPETYLVPSGLSLNDVTGTKQHLTARTGVMALASSTSSAYWGFINLDFDTPSITSITPTDEEVGIKLQPLIQVRTSDPGMGIRRSSIVMRFDGQVVQPTISGNAADYLLGWTPLTPLSPGTIHTLEVDVQDLAYPPHSATKSLRFRAEMTPSPTAFQVNFQPTSGASPAGYLVDSGSSYNFDRAYGWSKSLTPERANVHPDVRLDTYIDRLNSSSKRTWTFDVANGIYRVTLVAGAPDVGGKQRVRLENDLIFNNLTTSAGQFLSVTDYAVPITDGRLDIEIGGAGGSTYTQLCYVTFQYAGPPPPPPPPGNVAAPRPVGGLRLARSANNLSLTWNAVTEDTTGALITVTRYHVYRGTDPRFLPDRANHTNRIGVASGASYVDLGAASSLSDLYYIVTAERSEGAESARASNLGTRMRVAFAPATGTLESRWIALPYNTSYANASGLVTALNGGAGAGPIVGVGRLARSTQEKQSYTYSAGSWSGTNFALIPGEAIELVAQATFTAEIIGSSSEMPVYGFAFRTDISNLSWISLPQNAVYADARSLVTALNGSTSSGPVTKVAWLDPATSRVVSWLYLDGGWRGTNFALGPHQGVAILVQQDLPVWSPARVQP